MRIVALGALALVSYLASTVVLGHDSDYGDPADPNSVAAPLVLRRAFERDRSVDVRPRAWRELFSLTGALRTDPPLKSGAHRPGAGGAGL